MTRTLGTRDKLRRDVASESCELENARQRNHHGLVIGKDARTPNDPKLSDCGGRRGTCMLGGKAAAKAGAVTHGAVRCSAWLGVAVGLGKVKSLRVEILRQSLFG